jgi:hypothetical protein
MDSLRQGCAGIETKDQIRVLVGKNKKPQWPSGEAHHGI